MKNFVVVIVLFGAGVAAGQLGIAYFPHLDRAGLSCVAPSGAMSAVRYQEIFIGKLSDLKFGCIPMLRGVCGYLCTEFTARDEQEKHVIGYVWRDIMNQPHAAACSPDGGKAGSFYGECPVGTPVATVYRCPWCEPDLSATADTRGELSGTR